MIGTIVRFANASFWVQSTENVPELLLTRFGIAEKEYWFSGNEVHLRLCGGKGGFGRAMRQEGERRSRKLPPHKDACRTLSGKRIAALKAKKRIQSLKTQIELMERNRDQVKSMNRQSNVERELEIIDQKQQDIGEGLQKAVAEGITRTGQKDDARPTTVDDFSLLFESP
jgi:hypothetical protein